MHDLCFSLRRSIFKCTCTKRTNTAFRCFILDGWKENSFLNSAERLCHTVGVKLEEGICAGVAEIRHFDRISRGASLKCQVYRETEAILNFLDCRVL